MKKIPLLYVTPRFSLLSLSKLVPMSAPLYTRGLRKQGCVCVSEKKGLKSRERERDMMVWEKAAAG